MVLENILVIKYLKVITETFLCCFYIIYGKFLIAFLKANSLWAVHPPESIIVTFLNFMIIDFFIFFVLMSIHIVIL